MKKDKENISDMLQPLSKEELVERAYKRDWREFKIAKMRAAVLKNQIARAYEILENIRFDFLGDTMFRDYFTKAKRELEGAMCDFLLSDQYWEEKIANHRKMSIKEYEKKVYDVIHSAQSK